MVEGLQAVSESVQVLRLRPAGAPDFAQDDDHSASKGRWSRQRETPGSTMKLSDLGHPSSCDGALFGGGGGFDDLALHFAQAGSLAAETAEIEELGAANLVGTELFDLVDDLGVEGKDALDALAEAHLADGEGAVGAAAAGDDHAFESLEALFLAFLDLDLTRMVSPGANAGRSVRSCLAASFCMMGWMDMMTFLF